jgi:hypothetical protein
MTDQTRKQLDAAISLGNELKNPVSDSAIYLAKLLLERCTREPSHISRTFDRGLEINWTWTNVGRLDNPEVEITISPTGKFDIRISTQVLARDPSLT